MFTDVCCSKSIQVSGLRPGLMRFSHGHSSFCWENSLTSRFDIAAMWIYVPLCVLFFEMTRWAVPADKQGCLQEKSDSDAGFPKKVWSVHGLLDSLKSQASHLFMQVVAKNMNHIPKAWNTTEKKGCNISVHLRGKTKHQPKLLNATECSFWSIRALKSFFVFGLYPRTELSHWEPLSDQPLAVRSRPPARKVRSPRGSSGPGRSCSRDALARAPGPRRCLWEELCTSRWCWLLGRQQLPMGETRKWRHKRIAPGLRQNERHWYRLCRAPQVQCHAHLPCTQPTMKLQVSNAKAMDSRQCQVQGEVQTVAFWSRFDAVHFCIDEVSNFVHFFSSALAQPEVWQMQAGDHKPEMRFHGWLPQTVALWPARLPIDPNRVLPARSDGAKCPIRKRHPTTDPAQEATPKSTRKCGANPKIPRWWHFCLVRSNEWQILRKGIRSAKLVPRATPKELNHVVFWSLVAWLFPARSKVPKVRWIGLVWCILSL